MMPEWLQIAIAWPTVRRSLKFAVLVGAILIGINHYDAILRGDVDTTRALKMALTVTVPYLVSTASSVGAALEMRRDADRQTPR